MRRAIPSQMNRSSSSRKRRLAVRVTAQTVTRTTDARRVGNAEPYVPEAATFGSSMGTRALWLVGGEADAS